MKRRGDSLLESVPRDDLEAVRLDRARAELRARMDGAMKDFERERTRDSAALGRLYVKLARAVQEVPWPAGMEGVRQRIVGAYFERAAQMRRRAGRPANSLEGLYLHVWHTLNLERKAAGKPLLTGRVPADAIAGRCCAEYGLDATDRQVSDALSERRRTIACPYYRKNTGN